MSNSLAIFPEGGHFDKVSKEDNLCPLNSAEQAMCDAVLISDLNACFKAQ